MARRQLDTGQHTPERCHGQLSKSISQSGWHTGILWWPVYPGRCSVSQQLPVERFQKGGRDSHRRHRHIDRHQEQWRQYTNRRTNHQLHHHFGQFGRQHCAGHCLKNPVATGLNCTTVTCAFTAGVASCPSPLSMGVLQSTGLSITPSFDVGSTVTFVVSCGVTANGQ